MQIERAARDFLQRHPRLKGAARPAYPVYQRAIRALSHPKIIIDGPVRRVTPKDGFEYLFGYYDKSPWSANEQHMLCLRARNTLASPAPAEPAEVVLLDVARDYAPLTLAQTRTWNTQQGCMLQWLGPDQEHRIIYNDFRDGAYRSIIRDVGSTDERILPLPVYAVAGDGSFALTLDFSRLHRLRPGYGYSNLPDTTTGQLVPDGPCVWRLDLASGEQTPLVTYKDLVSMDHRADMDGAEHKVNHLMISPDGSRFIVLHRWITRHGRRFTRLVTANCDGSELYNLSDDDHVSHCYWRSADEILSYLTKANRGTGYYLLRDRSSECEPLWPELVSDGHPSYSPGGDRVVTDTYPDRKRIQNLYVIAADKVTQVARVFAPFRYEQDVRCDLHPRWDRSGAKVCIDAAAEGRRGVYVIDVAALRP